MAPKGLDKQGSGGPVEGRSFTMVEPVLQPLEESATTAPPLPWPDPHLMSDQHWAACDAATGGLPVPDVGATSTACTRGPTSSSSPVLSFGSAPCATQSLEGDGLVGVIWGPTGTHGHTPHTGC